MSVPRVSEKTEQSHIVQLLRSIGGKVYVLGHPSPNDGRRSRGTGQTPGIPDVLAFLHARADEPELLFVEVKASGGRLQPEQAEFEDLATRAHVAHIVGGLDAVIAWLTEREYVKTESFPTYRISK
jgi:hypothetical protein